MILKWRAICDISVTARFSCGQFPTDYANLF